MSIRLNDDLKTPYPVPSVCWGRTEIEDRTHVLCCFSADAINQYRLPDGSFPVGQQFNSPNSSIIVILAIPAHKVFKEDKDAKTKKSV